MASSYAFSFLEICIRREDDWKNPYHLVSQVPASHFGHFFTYQAVEDIRIYPVVRLRSEFDNDCGYAAVLTLTNWMNEQPADSWVGIPCPKDFESALWLRFAARAMRLKEWVYAGIYQRIKEHIAGPPDKFLSAEDFKTIAEVELSLVPGTPLSLAIDEVIEWHTSRPATELSRKHWREIVAYGVQTVGGKFLQYDTIAALIDETKLADPRLLSGRSRARSIGDMPCESNAAAQDLVRNWQRWQESWSSTRFDRRRTRQR